MRRHGILNSELARLINSLGHTDTWAVADCGLPIPAGVPVVDLAVVFGVPRFAEVVDAVLAEVVVESGTIADSTPAVVREMLIDVPLVETSHDELKALLSGCSFVIRTGETTPYANVIFRSGVPF